MKAIKMLPLLLVAMMFFVSACSKTVMENQSSTDQEPQPVAQTESESRTDEPAPTPQPLANDQDLDARGQFVQTHVYFDFDSAVLQPDAQDLLRVKAQWLQDNPGIAAVRIEGHCDERGTDAYNLALGARRAEAVKQYMTDMGVDVFKLEALSYGEEKPASPGKNEAAWAMNRRASFVLN